MSDYLWDYIVLALAVFAATWIGICYGRRMR